MEGIGSALKMMSGIRKCFVLKCPNGRYTFCGSVPEILCYGNTKSIFHVIKPCVFDSKDELLNFARSHGVDVEI